MTQVVTEQPKEPTTLDPQYQDIFNIPNCCVF